MPDVYLAHLNYTGLVTMKWAKAFAHKNWPMAVGSKEGVYDHYRDLDHARNEAVRDAIEKDCDFIFFWDDDVVPRKPNDSGRLVQAIMQENKEHITVLGGIYPRRSGLSEPIVSRKAGGGVWWKPIRQGGLHRCHMTGTGFIIMRLAHLQAFDVPAYKVNGKNYRQYFLQTAGYPERPQMEIVTDDFYFGRVVEKNGGQWWVDGGVICDQIDPDGRVYRIEDAEPAQAK